jgi:hypothetical protein
MNSKPPFPLFLSSFLLHTVREMQRERERERAPSGEKEEEEEEEEGEAKEEVQPFGAGVECLVCAPCQEDCWLQS